MRNHKYLRCVKRTAGLFCVTAILCVNTVSAETIELNDTHELVEDEIQITENNTTPQTIDVDITNADDSDVFGFSENMITQEAPPEPVSSYYNTVDSYERDDNVIDLTDISRYYENQVEENKPKRVVGLTAAGTENGIERVRKGWTKDENGRRYITQDNAYATGIIEINGKWYAFDENGYAMDGWLVEDGQQRYAVNGELMCGSVHIDGKIYVFDSEGYLASGWQISDADVFYADGGGIAKTGWFEADGNKYFADENGVIENGWIFDGKGLYYQTDFGIVTGVQTIDNNIRLFRDSGMLASGKFYMNGKPYFADGNGFPVTGWFNTETGTVYALADGELLTGWQTIDGKQYYFDKSGNMANGFTTINDKLYMFSEDGECTGEMPGNRTGKEISNAFENVSMSYTGILYEGDYPDPKKLNVMTTNNARQLTFDEIEFKDGWNEPAYGTVTLSIHTEYGDAEIEIPSIPVVAVTAAYEKEIASGDTPILQNIRVEATYDDGTVRKVENYDCELPITIDEGQSIIIKTPVGNSNLVFNTTDYKNMIASYDGTVREGELPNINRIHVWNIDENGRRSIIPAVSMDDSVVTGDTIRTVKTENGEAECKIHCVKIESVQVRGDVYEGETLNEKELLVRFEDGTTKIITPGDYQWENNEMILTASKGTSDKKISYLGKTFTVTIEARGAIQFTPSNTMFGSMYSQPNEFFQYTTRTSLGVWTLTAYADTPEDQGPYVGKTASGAPLIEGRTVAVSAATMNRLGLHFGDKLEINGHIYTIEDNGGSAMHDKNWVDIFVADPAREYDAAYNTPSEVFLLR